MPKNALRMLNTSATIPRGVKLMIPSPSMSAITYAYMSDVEMSVSYLPGRQWWRGDDCAAEIKKILFVACSVAPRRHSAVSANLKMVFGNP